jgi:hypothetical protein
MHDGYRADQPDPGPRCRRPRRWRTWWRPGGARRTLRGRGPAAGWLAPHRTGFMGGTAWLVGQPVPHAALGDAVMDLSACMLPAWPWAPTGRRKDSRPPRPTAPPADRRRLRRTSGAGRGRVHTSHAGHPGGSRTHTLSGASDTTGGGSGDGDGPAGSHRVDSPGVGFAEPPGTGRSLLPASPPVSPPPPPSVPVGLGLPQ